jgi:hypothetical protein
VDELKYRVKVTNRPERETIIRKSLEASDKEEEFYDFRNRTTLLKIIQVRIDLLIYRTENFRTFTDQKEYIVRERKPPDYFQAGQENETVQQVQHGLLVKLAREGRLDSVVPIIDVLKKERQRERILITQGGVVVNGNRRLAAMRELYADNPGEYAHFSHVDCQVLPPDALPEDIIDIEASLQAKPETKLDYDWIGDCQLINKLVTIHGKGSLPEVARRLNRREKEVRNSLQALTEADLYLKDWAKAEGEYSRVRDGEQLFKDLPALLENKDATLIEGSRVIAWMLYDNRKKLGGRLYGFNLAFGKKAADVLDRVANNLGVPLDEAPVETGEGFEVALDDNEGAFSYEPVIEALRDPERHSETVETLIDVAEDVVESERNRRSGKAALKAVVDAHAKLVGVDLSKAAADSYAALEKQLDAVISKAGELKEKLSKYKREVASKESRKP